MFTFLLEQGPGMAWLLSNVMSSSFPAILVLFCAYPWHAGSAIPPYEYMQRYVVVNASARGALCNDGSAAAYYVRNCTANGDAKPGDPDFCAKGEGHCNLYCNENQLSRPLLGNIEGVLRYQWFIVFEDDNLFCWDDQSCHNRDPQVSYCAIDTSDKNKSLETSRSSFPGSSHSSDDRE